jgi:peptidoglycan/LPS O-acetylase OafA/YrhL
MPRTSLKLWKMEYNKLYKQKLSAAITWLRFPLIFFIILLHCYSVVRLEGDHDTYFKFLYPFSLWIGETGVPGFFFISGYLFFLSKKNYKQKLKTRFYTLLIPYLLWNAILLTVYLLAYAAGYPQDINYKSITDYGLMDYLRLFWDRGSYDDGNFVPLLCPFWYIRNLLIMCLLSPIFYYVIRYAREFFLFIVAVWWMLTYHNAFIPQSILFFSIGAYFSIEQKNPIVMLQKYRIVFLCFWVIAFLIDWAHCFVNVPNALYFHRISLLLNIFLLFLVGNYFGNINYLGRKILDKSAFWIYTVHYPMTIAFGTISARYLQEAPDWQVFVYYWCIVLCVTALCVISYVILHRMCPKVLSFVTGNRV